jgi:hypothetical protein
MSANMSMPRWDRKMNVHLHLHETHFPFHTAVVAQLLSGVPALALRARVGCTFI